MTPNDEQTPTTPGRIVLFVLACVLAVAVPMVVMRTLFVNDDAGTSARRPATTKAATSATTPTSATVTTTANALTPAAATARAELAADAETCRLTNLRQQAASSAAEVSLAQFQKHIDAMNLLVAGKISLSVATTFWDQTRVGAVENAAAFHRADKELRSSKSACPAPAAAVADAAPYGQVVAIQRCATAISARSAAMARARTVMATWEHHIHDMEMLRMGHITPAQATAAWNKNWKTGQKQLASFESAQAKANKAPCALG